jgi:alkylhydroperoxidase family enzyme
LIAGSRVPDAVCSAVAVAFSEAELAELVVAIATIDAWNHLNIARRLEPVRDGAVRSV